MIKLLVRTYLLLKIVVLGGIVVLGYQLFEKYFS